MSLGAEESRALVDELREEVAVLRTRLAAAEAREAELREALDRIERRADAQPVFIEDVAKFDLKTIAAEARDALAQKPNTSALSAALASEWERAYRAGLEAAAKQIEHAPNCHEERRKAEASGATLNAQFGCGYCAAGERARALPVPARPAQWCADLVRDLTASRPEDKP